MKILSSENIFYSLSQKLGVLISPLASFELFHVIVCSTSPDNDFSFGSISVFSGTFLTSDLALGLINHYVG